MAGLLVLVSTAMTMTSDQIFVLVLLNRGRDSEPSEHYFQCTPRWTQHHTSCSDGEHWSHQRPHVPPGHTSLLTPKGHVLGNERIAFLVTGVPSEHSL